MNKKNVMRFTAIFGLLMFVMLGLSCASLLGGLFGNTVTFFVNGANGPIPVSQKVKKDNYITLPDANDLSFGDATFGGWMLYLQGGGYRLYEPGFEYTPSNNVEFIAKWNLDIDTLENASGLVNKLIWLQNNAQSNRNYILEIDKDETIPGQQWLYYHGKSNITITLRGIGANRLITFITRDYLFNASWGVTLILDNNITLHGSDRQAENIVRVSGGTFIMNNGSTVTGFRIKSNFIFSSVIHVINGVFNMNGGNISNNNGAGVYVNGKGTFNMNGGSITNNTNIGSISRVTSGQPTVYSSAGGGVLVYYDGTFTMNGGNITGNRGGGVVVQEGGSFTMNQGTISRNTAYDDNRGGGVYLWNNTTFRRLGGSIFGNTPDDVYKLP